MFFFAAFLCFAAVGGGWGVKNGWSWSRAGAVGAVWFLLHVKILRLLSRYRTVRWFFGLLPNEILQCNRHTQKRCFVVTKSL